MCLCMAQETGRHPLSGDELKKEDLITLKSNKVCRTLCACSHESYVMANLPFCSHSWLS